MEVEDIKRLNMVKEHTDTKTIELECNSLLNQIVLTLKRVTVDNTIYTVKKLRDILTYIKGL